MPKEIEAHVSNTFLKGMINVTSKDDLRPIMCGVYFDNGHAVATDANALVKVSLAMWGVIGDSAHLLDGYFASNDLLKEIKTLSKSQYLTIGEGCIKVWSGRPKPLKTLELEHVVNDNVGKYPDYEAVFPTTFGPVEQFQINGKLLNNVQDVYIQAVERSTGIDRLRIRTTAHARALTIDSTCGNFKGLLMPLLVSSDFNK